MLFDDEEISGRHLFLDMKKRRKQKKSSLKVNMSLKAKKKAFQRNMSISVVAAVAIAIVGVVLWFGFQSAGKLLFSENSMFTVKNLDVRPGAVISESLIKEYLGLDEGMNIFGFDIKKTREIFLADVPNVESLEISRRLPGTVKVVVVERVPLARLERAGQLVVDHNGCVFLLRNKLRDLPFVNGCKGGGSLKPGSRINGKMSLAAIEVLALCSNPQVSLHIAAVDVEKGYLMIRLDDGKQARLNWENMGEMNKESRSNLLTKLNQWVAALQTAKGKRDRMFNLTYSNRVYSE